MSAKPAIELVGLGALVPAIISLVVLVLTRRMFPDSAARRYMAALAFGIAFCVGFACSLSGLNFVPKRHWHWLPYLCALAMVIGPVGLAGGVYAVERRLLQLLVSVVAAWLLVPTWSDLRPTRPVSISLLAGYLFVLMALLEPLANRLSSRLFPGLLVLVAVWLAVLAAATVSETYGRVAGLAAAGIFGAWLGTRFLTDPMSTQGLIPALAVVLGGAAYVSCIEPQPPAVGMLIVPAAPLALWSCVWGPLARLEGMKSALLRVAAVLIPLVAAFIWVEFFRAS